MEPFNWVDIDGIRYSWDGQDNIVCSGRFGYQATMTGNKINALDLESEDGEVAGALNADFAASSISFTPAEDAPLPHMLELVGGCHGIRPGIAIPRSCSVVGLLSFRRRLAAGCPGASPRACEPW